MTICLSCLIVGTAELLPAELDLVDSEHLELGPLAVELDFLAVERMVVDLLAVQRYCFSS